MHSEYCSKCGHVLTVEQSILTCYNCVLLEGRAYRRSGKQLMMFNQFAEQVVEIVNQHNRKAEYDCWRT